MASITTPIAGIPEIVADGGAILIPVGDASALTDAIVKLTSDHALRERLGKEARQTIEDRYTAGKVLPRLAAMYRLLLKARAAA